VTARPDILPGTGRGTSPGLDPGMVEGGLSPLPTGMGRNLHGAPSVSPSGCHLPVPGRIWEVRP
jgi:hypothetical protein